MILAASLLIAARRAGASELHGLVTFSSLPVPGATVTATRADASRATVTDEQGRFRLANLDDGSWTIDVAMMGFSPIRRDIVVSPDTPPADFPLTVLPFDQIAAGRTVRNEPAPVAPSTGGSKPSPRPPSGGGFERAAVTTSPAASAPAATPAATAPAGDAVVAGGDAGADRSADAADGFLINGSVNNSAASPFAQLPAFGNNRRGPRSLYSGGIGVLLGNSAWDARPFSFTDQQTPRPSYSDAQVVGSFAGPVKLPGLRNKANLFLGYQHTSNHDATTQSAIVPTAAERRGEIARHPVPASSIVPQAAALLALYPLPNVDGGGRYNFQTPVLLTTTQDALQTRLIESLTNKTQIYGTVSLQRTATDAGNLFGFVDSTAVSGIDAPVTWSHRYSQFFTLRLRYQFTALTTQTTPYFANRENIAADAGIGGTSQDPVNWGPSNLIFSSGIAGLSSAQYASNRDRTHASGGEMLINRGRHNVTVGGDLRVRHLDIVSQQNARGTFTFTGSATGSDFADFLLGLPHASSIAFGNPDKNFRATSSDVYITDDWRMSAAFTANIGLRWEYESPFTETQGRLVNLDVAPGFTSVSQAVGGSPIRPDFRGLQPRIGVAWRPLAGSSLVIRGGYGIYRNSAVYQAIDLSLAQQPPLSTTASVETSAEHPLTLANGFAPPRPGISNTFAVDPDLRVGYAHNWQLLVQRDLPASLTMTATYLGTKGSHMLQEFLPNTYPIGAVNPCPSCPSGFVYLESNASSSRHAGQFQLRRRLRNGLTASLQYTLSKATDDAAAAFVGASVNGAAVAQDWLNLDAERAPSNFDQRHLATAQVQYTSGVGVAGGSLIDGIRGALFKGWTVTSQLTAGSGLPLTPIYLTSVPGTGVTGSIRGDVTGASTDAPSGFYANPTAYAPPASGQWGTAGRNSIRGPALFSLNASLGRSFIWTERLTLDWRIDAINVLNRVTYTGVNTIVGSPQFGLPIQANAMRKLQSSLRLRF